ncbi:MAG: pilus assembly protein TadG-related protein [Blastocatellales bacterium]
MKRIFTPLDTIRNFSRLRQQKGSIMVLTTVMILGMVGMLALAVDLGFLFSARNQLQNGIDAATLAAGAGLRVTIEADPAAPQQTLVARTLAIQYAGYNQVRRYADPDPNGNQPNANNITIASGDVAVDTSNYLPRVRVSTTIPTPLLFAGVFGFNSINMGATATASLLPVDGGTGTIGSGTSIGGGCWRPLLLPDTFYDASNTLVTVGPSLPSRVPSLNGDYYRSRFAAGGRNTYPFVDSIGSAGSSVTSLRDTQLQADIGTVTVMGQPVSFNPSYYFIGNFSSLPRATFDVLSVGDIANFGYCGKIRVGDDIPVYARNDATAYDQVRIGLLALQYRTIGVDSIDIVTETLFRYVTSSSYPGPNTHGAIIPVLLYNPLIWKDPATVDSTTVLTVTNIGLFFLKNVTPNGDLEGYFVREVISGGTPIDSTNMMVDSGVSFKQRWLPMSVQLLK